MRKTALTVALAGLLALPAAAQGSITFGTTFSAPGASIDCGSCTAWSPSVPAANTLTSLTSPIRGVLTSYSVDGLPNQFWYPINLRVIAAFPNNTWVGLGASTPPVTPPTSGGLQTYPARVPVGAGQYIGLDAGRIQSALMVDGASFAYYTSQDIGPLPPNSPQQPTATIPGLGLGIQATVEPDADCDGFGDETQDENGTTNKTACLCPPDKATAVGTTGDDLLTGTRGRDVILGLSGDDRIKGLGGNDAICGHDGQDRLIGGKGSDVLDGGLHADKVTE